MQVVCNKFPHMHDKEGIIVEITFVVVVVS